MQFTKRDTNAVKGFAILMMMFHHLFLDASRYKGFEINFAPLGEEKTVLIAQFCKICVAVFVFLSGYGIAYSLKNIDKNDNLAYKKQISKRYFSLMSGFWFVYIVCVALAAIFERSMFSVYEANNMVNTVLYVIADFMGLSELFGTPIFIGTWWYMSLAIIIVAIMPLLYKLYEKFGTIALLITTMLFCGIFEQKNYDMVRWTFTLALGIIFSEKNLLTKIKEFRFIKKNKVIDYLLKLVLYSGIIVGCMYLRTYAGWEVSYLRDGIIPTLVIIWCYTILSEIKFLYVAIEFIGKHSMDIFLSHTLLRGYILKDFIYSQKYSLVIFVVLTVLSLVFAIVIDLLKKITGYKKFVSFVTAKITGYEKIEKTS